MACLGLCFGSLAFRDYAAQHAEDVASGCCALPRPRAPLLRPRFDKEAARTRLAYSVDAAVWLEVASTNHMYYTAVVKQARRRALRVF